MAFFLPNPTTTLPYPRPGRVGCWWSGGVHAMPLTAAWCLLPLVPGRINIHSHTRVGTGFPYTVLVTAHYPALTTGLHNVQVFVSSSLQTCQGLSDLHITCPLTGFQHYPYALQHAFGSLSYLS